MTTATYEQLKNELKKELFNELSELIVRDAKDAEGEYRPEFVKRILRIAQRAKKGPNYNKKNFLKLIS